MPRHSWTTGESGLPDFGNPSVIEDSMFILRIFEQYFAGDAFRPFVQENQPKNQPRTKL
jgi:hypothetical protein